MSTTSEMGVVTADVAERVRRIQAAMEVEDASGERFGRVIDVWIDTAPAIGKRDAPSVPEELADRLLGVGYIKIEDRRYFRRDFRYYVTIDQVSSVDASVVRLDRYCRDLITAFD
jgi:hypothetical protein